MIRPVNWTAERKLFKAVTEGTALIAWATDETGNCFYLSPAWYQFTGTSGEDGIGFNWLTSVHRDDVAKVRQAFFKANDERLAFGMAFRLEHADGDYRAVWDVGLPKFGDDGEFHGFFGTTCVIENYDLASSHLADKKATTRPMLSPRECEILTLVAEGNTSEMVANSLGINGRTVDTHIANAAAKLGTHNRVHTVAKAVRLNVI